MIKVLLGIAIALLIALSAAYLLIPSTIVFSKVISLKATVGGTERAFNTTAERLKWWPEKSADAIGKGGRPLHTFENYQYEFPAYTFSGSSVWIYHGDKKISSSLHFVPLLKDSVAVKWKAELFATKNPFKKNCQLR